MHQVCIILPQCTMMKAADNGVVNAMYYVGENYSKGEIVKKNNVNAYKWIKQSIVESSVDSDATIVEKRKIKMKAIEKKLTPEQIAAVNKKLGYKD